jgi:hypothetical protein
VQGGHIMNSSIGGSEKEEDIVVEEEVVETVDD